jgi:hypothetical protein
MRLFAQKEEMEAKMPYMLFSLLALLYQRSGAKLPVRYSLGIVVALSSGIGSNRSIGVLLVNQPGVKLLGPWLLHGEV